VPDVLGSLGPTNTAYSELGFHVFFSMYPENLLVILLPCCYLLLLALLQYLLSVKSCGTVENIATICFVCYSLVLLPNVLVHVKATIYLLLNTILTSIFCHFATNMHFEVLKNFTTVYTYINKGKGKSLPL
jgi:hypothetical protein